MNKLTGLLLTACLLLSQGLLAAVKVPGPVVDTDWLAANLDQLIVGPVDARTQCKGADVPF